MILPFGTVTHVWKRSRDFITNIPRNRVDVDGLPCRIANRLPAEELTHATRQEKATRILHNVFQAQAPKGNLVLTPRPPLSRNLKGRPVAAAPVPSSQKGKAAQHVDQTQYLAPDEHFKMQALEENTHKTGRSLMSLAP